MTPSVPPLWPDSTIAILASGPSLTQADVDVCRGRARVLAIKDAIRLAPWADCLYGCGLDGSRWWQLNGDGLNFQGVAYTLDPASSAWAMPLEQTGITGIETKPTGLRTGKNSGYQAINLAVHLGASRIVLLGYDMQPNAKGIDHFFGPRDRKPPYAAFLPLFETLIEPLRTLGVQVINCSRQTELKCFPRLPLAEALA